MRTVILIAGVIIVDAIERTKGNFKEINHSLVVTFVIALVCSIFMDIIDFINSI